MLDSVRPPGNYGYGRRVVGCGLRITRRTIKAFLSMGETAAVGRGNLITQCVIDRGQTCPVVLHHIFQSPSIFGGAICRQLMFGQPIVLEFHVHFLILLALLRVLAQHLLVGSAGVVLVAAEIGTSSWDRCLRGHGCVLHPPPLQICPGRNSTPLSWRPRRRRR